MPVTGRPDGVISVEVTRDGLVVSSQSVVVACDVAVPEVSEPEVVLVDACRAGLGFVGFQFANSSASATSYVIRFEGVPNRSTTAAGYGQAFRGVSGRPDGDYFVTITAGPRRVLEGTVAVRCAELDDGPPQFLEGAIEASVTNDEVLVSWPPALDSSGIASYTVTVGDHSFEVPGARTSASIPRMAPDGAWDFSQTGRYAVSVQVQANDGLGATLDQSPGLGVCLGRTVTWQQTDGPDVLLGTEGPDQIDGLGGDDVICGMGGADEINGGAGDDLIDGGLGDDIIDGAAGDDSLLGGDGADELSGGEGADSVIGGADNDLISGGPGNDLLGGGDHNDEISGGDGQDTLYGDGGVDVIEGGRGSDFADGGEGNDSLYAGSRDETLYTADGDVLFGGAGIDLLTGADGDDELYGGPDRDSLTGRGGDDLIDGGTGVLFAQGNDGADVIWGGDDSDTLNAGPGPDSVFAGGGGDSVWGDGEVEGASPDDGDLLIGGADGDIIWGNAGNDWIDGGAGPDTLNGAAGDDVVYGGFAGESADDLDLGSGADTVLLPGDSTAVSDFVVGTDEVQARVDDASLRAIIGGSGCDGYVVEGSAFDCMRYRSIAGTVPLSFPGANLGAASVWIPIVLYDATGNSTSFDLTNLRDAYATYRDWGLPQPATSASLRNRTDLFGGFADLPVTGIALTGSTNYQNQSTKSGLIELGANWRTSPIAAAQDLFPQFVFGIVPADRPELNSVEGRRFMESFSTWAAYRATGRAIDCSPGMPCNTTVYERPYGTNGDGVLFFEYMYDRAGGYGFIQSLMLTIDRHGSIEEGLRWFLGSDYRDRFWEWAGITFASGAVTCAQVPCEVAMGSVDAGGTLIDADEPNYRDDHIFIELGTDNTRRDQPIGDGEIVFRVRGYLNPRCVQFSVECRSMLGLKFRPEYTAQAIVLHLFNSDLYQDSCWYCRGIHISQALQWEVSRKGGDNTWRIDILEGLSDAYEIKRHTGDNTRQRVNSQLNRYLLNSDGINRQDIVDELQRRVERGQRTGWSVVYRANDAHWVVWAPEGEPGHIYFATLEEVRSRGLRIDGVSLDVVDQVLEAQYVDPLAVALGLLGAGSLYVTRGKGLPATVGAGATISAGSG